MVVEHGRQKVVGGTDGMKVAREVQVDVLHGNYLRIAAASRAAFHAEYRTQRRLTQGHSTLHAATAQRVSQADGGGRLAFSCGSGIDRRHKHEFALVCGLFFQ